VGAFVATGTGSYGCPVQQGAGTVGEHGVISFASWAVVLPSRSARRESTAVPWSGNASSVSRLTVSTCADVFCTSAAAAGVDDLTARRRDHDDAVVQSSRCLGRRIRVEQLHVVQPPEECHEQ